VSFRHDPRWLAVALWACATAPDTSQVCDWVIRCAPDARCKSDDADAAAVTSCLTALDAVSCGDPLPAACEPLVRTGDEIPGQDTGGVSTDADSGGPTCPR